MEEARIKEDNELEMRAQKRQRQREAIERSRQIQLELQEQRRKADVEENMRLAIHYEQKVRRGTRRGNADDGERNWPTRAFHPPLTQPRTRTLAPATLR